MFTILSATSRQGLRLAIYNAPISPSQIKEVIGTDKIDAFANKLAIDRDKASQDLAQVLPELIDRSSQGGNLLSSIGGKGRLAGFALRFLSKSAWALHQPKTRFRRCLRSTAKDARR